MYTVKQITSIIGISKSSVHGWSREYADLLSTHANPAPGVARHYSDSDVSILQTVKVLRDQFEPHSSIYKRLLSGERLEPDEAEDLPPPAVSIDTPQSLAPTELFQWFTSMMESANQARIEAEKAASAEKTRADMLQAQLDELKASGKRKRRWWPWG